MRPIARISNWCELVRACREVALAWPISASYLFWSLPPGRDRRSSSLEEAFSRPAPRAAWVRTSLLRSRGVLKASGLGHGAGRGLHCGHGNSERRTRARDILVLLSVAPLIWPRGRSPSLGQVVVVEMGFSRCRCHCCCRSVAVAVFVTLVGVAIVLFMDSSYCFRCLSGLLLLLLVLGVAAVAVAVFVINIPAVVSIGIVVIFVAAAIVAIVVGAVPLAIVAMAVFVADIVVVVVDVDVGCCHVSSFLPRFLTRTIGCRGHA